MGNDSLNLHGFNLERKDRKNGRAGGVACYLRSDLLYSRLIAYEDDELEVIWADMSLLVVPRVNLERFGRRAFSCAGPSLWNSLPCVLRTQQDVERFRRDLQTYLFKQAFV